MGTHGIVLFGHGSRDPRWAEPFARLLQRLKTAHDGAGPVALAFLELMTPDLATAVREQVEAGCLRVTIVPVFFGQGGHVRRDLPALVAACQAAHPGISIRCANAAGEDDAVLDAVAAYCLRQA